MSERLAKCGCCGQRLPKKLSAAQVVSVEYLELPVSEMLARGWFGDSTRIQDADDLRNRLCRFFSVKSEAELRETLGMAP